MEERKKISNLEDLFKQKDAKGIYEFFYEQLKKKELINMSEIFEAERIIVDTKNVEVIKKWAEAIDCLRIENLLVKAKDVNTILYFARNVKGCNIPKLENAIIKFGDAEDMFKFALYVNGSNKHKLRKAIMATNDAFWIREWKACFGIYGLFFFQK